jgi:hypothetical protein
MARIRTIKPDFWTDEKLTECSMSTRLFFVGTWNFADDNGNLTRSAKKLKMQIFPADSVDCEEMVQELIGAGVLVEYEADGEKFLHIKGFAKHQVINRPSKSSIPEPPIVKKKAPKVDDSVKTHGAFTDGREGKGKEVNTYEAFASFWSVYPKKKNKGQAEKAFAKLNPDDDLLQTILNAVEGASHSADWLKSDGQYIPHPATWLNAKGWEDEGVCCNAKPWEA